MRDLCAPTFTLATVNLLVQLEDLNPNYETKYICDLFTLHTKGDFLKVNFIVFAILVQ